MEEDGSDGGVAVVNRWQLWQERRRKGGGGEGGPVAKGGGDEGAVTGDDMVWSWRRGWRR